MLKTVSRPFNRINNGHSKDPLMLSQEYASSIIDALIKNGIIITKETVADDKRLHYSAALKGRE